jgi:protein-tyrosine phosphatase
MVTNLPAEWETYLAQLSSENRNNLKRYTRRLGRHYQVEIYKCTNEADLPKCLEDLFELHQKRWQLRGEPGTFASTERRAFYFELSCALLKHGNLEFWLLTLNGKTAAAQFCFRQGESVFLLQEGFDPDHSADRVGFILRGHVLEQLVAAGVRRYDFLYGQSEGKQIWVPQLQHYLDIHFAKRGSRGALYLQWTNAAVEKKEWLRAHLPKSAWSALKRLNPKKRGAPAPKAEGTNSPAENQIAQPATPEGKRARKTAKRVAKVLLPKPLVQEIQRYRKYPRSERPVYTKVRIRDGMGLRPRMEPGSLAKAHAFVFVCFGNIMRSPMCEALMQRELESRPQLRVTVTSAGLNATPGKEAHPWSIASARQFGISLERHRARLLTQEMVDQADIIFAMDYQNQVEFLSRFPADKKKLFMLSDFAPSDYRQVEIGDPYYGDEEATRRCYGILEACIQNLVASLAQQTQPARPDGARNGRSPEEKEQPATPKTVRTMKDE